MYALIRVDLPTPGAPVNPTTGVVRGLLDTVSTSVACPGSSLSIIVMALANAMRSPPSNRLSNADDSDRVVITVKSWRDQWLAAAEFRAQTGNDLAMCCACLGSFNDRGKNVLVVCSGATCECVERPS